MKISRRWLSDFFNQPLPRGLADLLTRRGLEVEESLPVAVADGVVVGRVLSNEQHPRADKLQCCQVAAADANPLQIVCGAPNVRASNTVAVAPPGAKIGGATIGKRDIRGVESEGMILSAAELGVGSDGEGILQLPENIGAPGDSLSDALLLHDCVYNIAVTPNRGDCLSHLGVAREIAAQCGIPLTPPADHYVAGGDEVFPVAIADNAATACRYYGGVVIRGADLRRPTPLKIRLLLERCGQRCVNPAVDVTNYLMLMLGQPLHAFDLDKLRGGIQVRFAAAGEKLALLNGDIAVCRQDTLMIADDKKAVALAGVMGGIESAVDDDTRNLFLEGAFFAPAVVRGRIRQFNLASEAAFRFERGVDEKLAPTALRMAATLIKDICGGKSGEINSVCRPAAAAAPIVVGGARIRQTLGMNNIDDEQAAELLNNMQISAVLKDGDLRVTPPSWRFDLERGEDIVEEVIRAWGYHRLPETVPQNGRGIPPLPKQLSAAHSARRFFAARGFFEVVNYAFVPVEWERDAHGNRSPIRLQNPMSDAMAVMRSSLLRGLLECARFNFSHRQERAFLFELGRCFLPAADDALPLQPQRVGGIMAGTAAPAHWAEKPRPADFYDLKGVLESFLALEDAQFLPASSPPPILHPHKTAAVALGGEIIGALGELHPALAAAHDFRRPPLLFELNFDQIIARRQPPVAAAVSRLPVTWRDLAMLARRQTPVRTVLDCARAAARPPVVSVSLFDYYVGDKIARGQKSVGLRVMLQGEDKNLTESEICAALDGICLALSLEGIERRAVL